MENEIWKDIQGYEGLYRVSNLGNVIGLEIKTKFGTGYKIYPLRNIRVWNDKKGYCYVTLSKNKKAKHFLLHRLVALSFLKNKENKPQINHKNGIKSDNTINNLEWCTAKENLEHAVKKGLNLKHSIYNYQSKLSLNDVDFIRKCNLTQKELKIKFNISQTSISKVLLNKTYK